MIVGLWFQELSLRQAYIVFEEKDLELKAAWEVEQTETGRQHGRAKVWKFKVKLRSTVAPFSLTDSASYIAGFHTMCFPCSRHFKLWSQFLAFSFAIGWYVYLSKITCNVLITAAPCLSNTGLEDIWKLISFRFYVAVSKNGYKNTIRETCFVLMLQNCTYSIIKPWQEPMNRKD